MGLHSVMLEAGGDFQIQDNESLRFQTAHNANWGGTKWEEVDVQINLRPLGDGRAVYSALNLRF